MSNENVARMISGMDSGEHFNLGTREAENTFNEQVDNYLDKFEKHSQDLENYAKNLSEDLNGLEVMPLYGYVLIEPFRQNPFQKLKVSESGFIMDNGGRASEYKSEEDGEIHEEQQFIKVGTVIETGHKCEFIQPGDIVMYINGGVGTHVGIYIGNGMMIHAGTPQTGIIVAPMYAGYRVYSRIIY